MKQNAIQYGLLIALAGSCAAEAADPVRVDVAMVDYRFSPDHLSLEHGAHYQLHLENRGKELHEFTAPTFFAAAKLDNPQVLNREHTEVVVQPGESKDVFFTPGPPGAYDLRCGDHDWDGMVGGITVR
jgi:plastocyanin